MGEDILWAAILRNLSHIKSAAKYTMGRYANKHRLRDVYEPTDLVHETLLKLLNNPTNVVELGEADKGLMALIYLTMYHVLLNWASGSNISKTTTSELPGQGLTYEYGGAAGLKKESSYAEPEIYAQLETQDNKDRVTDALELLAKTSPKAAIVLAYGMDLEAGDSPEVLAKQLGIPYNNYRKCRFDGIRVLRRYAA